MTAATAMYVSGLDFQTGQPIPVARNAGQRERQKRMLHPNPPNPQMVEFQRG